MEEIKFFDFPAPRLDTIASYKLASSLKELIFEFDIDTMYIPHRGDIHLDHRVTYDSCLVAARPIDGCPVKRIYAYETLSETEWAPPLQNDTFIPVVFEDISDFIEKKIEAFKMYRSQLKEYPHSRSVESIKALAVHRGVTVGYHYAEAFSLVREIR